MSGDRWQSEEFWGEIPGDGKDPAEARRELRLFGLPFEAALIPARATRSNVPSQGRPAFGGNRGRRIRREEAQLEDEGLLVTENRFPFFARQALLWPKEGCPREPEGDFLAAALRRMGELGASLACNSIGASATIPLSHLHLIGEPSPLLSALPLREVGAVPGARLLLPEADFPLLYLGVEASSPARAASLVVQLLGLRTTAAMNLIASGERVFVIPRRAEIPRPHFQEALGSAELWGRFVYADRDAFDAASAATLEAALLASCVPQSEREVEGIRAALEELD